MKITIFVSCSDQITDRFWSGVSFCIIQMHYPYFTGGRLGCTSAAFNGLPIGFDPHVYGVRHGGVSITMMIPHADFKIIQDAIIIVGQLVPACPLVMTETAIECSVMRVAYRIAEGHLWKCKLVKDAAIQF